MEPGPTDAGADARVLTETARAPPNAVKAEKLSVFLGARCLLSNTELKIAEPQGASRIYGLVGPNGCGKSTLLKLLAQRQLPVPETWDVFLVNQQLPTAGEHSVLEEVLRSHPRRAALLHRAAALEEPLEEPSESSDAELQEVHACLEEFQHAERDVIDILKHLGFASVSDSMSKLSGGWRMKVELAKALWLRPKLLLLDEPTNHLDFQASEWLTQQLLAYPHSVVVVSHDATFLHELCKEILWMTEQRLETLPNVSPEELLRMQRRKPLRFDFPASEDPLLHGISMHGVEFSYGSAAFRASGVRLSGRSRAVVLGRNGGGKTTFLELLSGILRPSKGSVDSTPGLKVGYYSQLTEELDNLSISAAEYLLQQCSEELRSHVGSRHSGRQRKTAKTAKEPKQASAAANRLLEVARGVLSNFGFEGELANVPVERLSGGQKACLKFAVLSLRPVHILLLDEPTNHLDAEGCRALAEALGRFQGGVVAVTHDELLIYRLITCNWNTSELFLCHAGCLWKQNFNAHTLKTIQEELRRVEQTTPTAPEPKPELKPQLKPKSGDVKVPPWLVWRKDKARPQSSEPAAVPVATEPVAAEPVTAEPADGTLQGQAEFAECADQTIQEMGRAQPEQAIEVLAAPAPVEVSAPESWEDLESNASTEAPEDIGPPTASRLRKDLVNLNKAAAKWADLERQGHLSQAELLERIRSSKAAAQLKQRQDFDEGRFVDGVLRRCRK
eukprot:CAMPEP_0181531326 /NCGR_PEP_ID=MMETSP1110-20121109/72048_1 /TAXON_ID=174948 /ORGANISM="Symbiodinium sp., Strain CCMP421" /LENGTH=730 /DNA_ID=CAMNT_0023662403 /DNA_START=40 /DNA_END=2232 /DNA_ORIENTATION=+